MSNILWLWSGTHFCGCIKVAEGQEICVIEAMKMQNSLTAVKQAKVTIWITESETSLLAVQLRDSNVHVPKDKRNRTEFNDVWWTEVRLELNAIFTWQNNAHRLVEIKSAENRLMYYLCMSRLRMSIVNQGRRWERETCWWSWNRTHC